MKYLVSIATISYNFLQKKCQSIWIIRQNVCLPVLRTLSRHRVLHRVKYLSGSMAYHVEFRSLTCGIWYTKFAKTVSLL